MNTRNTLTTLFAILLVLTPGAAAHALSFAQNTVFLEANTEAECEAQDGSYTEWYGEVYCTQEGEVIIEVTPNPSEIDFEAAAAAQIAVARSLVLIGLSATAAKDVSIQADVPFRVVQQDGEYYPVTMDYRPGRVNAVVTNGMVVSYTIEGADVEVQENMKVSIPEVITKAEPSIVEMDPVIVPTTPGSKATTTNEGELESESEVLATTPVLVEPDGEVMATSNFITVVTSWLRSVFSFLW